MPACIRLAFVATLLACQSVRADAVQPPLIDSIHAGISIHDVTGDEEGGIDGNAELRLTPLFGRDWAIEILPTVGGNVSFSGETNAAYLGGTARYRLTDAVFVEGFLGFTLHDADTPTQADGADLGCPLLFRQAVGLGYRIGRNAVSLYGSHMSHGGILCSDEPNDGLTKAGIRYGFHF